MNDEHPFAVDSFTSSANLHVHVVRPSVVLHTASLLSYEDLHHTAICEKPWPAISLALAESRRGFVGMTHSEMNTILDHLETRDAHSI